MKIAENRSLDIENGGPFNWLRFGLIVLALSGCGDRETHPQPAAKEAHSVPLKALGEEEVMGIEFVEVPAGCFEMGSPPGERGRDNDEMLHSVCVDRFWISRYEITNDQYRRFDPTHDSGQIRGNDMNGGKQPVVRVRFVDAMAFAQWLSKETGNHYRLPTEAEWEYGARAGTRSRFFWGNEAKHTCEYANAASATLDDRMYGRVMQDALCNDGFMVTAPVGQFKPNNLGLYDISGNVWEMTCSEYREIYDGQEKQCVSPREYTRLVYRGGSWTSIPYRLRVAARTSARQTYGNRELGFRLVRDVSAGTKG